MTIHEASEHYNIPIPISILREYESWGLCDTVKTVMSAWQYDDEAIERLSTGKTLDEIRFQERRLDRLDDLRHQMRKQSEKNP